MANGNGTKISLGILTAIVLPVLFFMGTIIKENDQAREHGDMEIRKEITQDRKEIYALLSKITTQLASIDTELRLSRRADTTRDDRDESRRVQ